MLTVADIQRELRVSRGRVLAWIGNGALRALDVGVGLGHAHRVHESDLQRFIEARWTSTPNKVFSEKRDFIS